MQAGTALRGTLEASGAGLLPLHYQRFCHTSNKARYVCDILTSYMHACFHSTLSVTTSKGNAWCRCGLRNPGGAAGTMRHVVSGGALGWVHINLLCLVKPVWLHIPSTLLQNAQPPSIAKST